MGRKIPAKKHRGVKDPLLQQAKRLESLKGKINAPPRDPDEQPMPRSLIRLFGLPDPKKKETNTSTKRRRSKTGHLAHGKDERGSDASANPISRLHKLPGESGRGFSLRINSAMKALQSPEEDIDYPQDLEAEDYKGQQMAEQRERRARKRRRAQRAGGAGGASGAGGEPTLSRTQKFALKKKAKKMQMLEERSRPGEPQYERVAFGDVAHAPPALRGGTAGARAARRGLLLAGAAPAELERRERARAAAVAAYRALRRTRK